MNALIIISFILSIASLLLTIWVLIRQTILESRVKEAYHQITSTLRKAAFAVGGAFILSKLLSKGDSDNVDRN